MAYPDLPSVPHPRSRIAAVGGVVHVPCGSHAGDPRVLDTEILEILKDTAPEVYQIGDCGNPALIIDAIGDGSRIGRAI